MRQIIVFFSVAILAVLTSYGQIGNQFWFAPPDVSVNHGAGGVTNGQPVKIHVTAVHATTVTISRPADPTFTPINISLSAQETQFITLNNIININDIEVYAVDPSLSNFIQPKGILITSYPGDITAFYELDNPNNRDIFALKGDNALGTEFYVSLQQQWPNGCPGGGNYGGICYNGFSVVAQQDNTHIRVYFNGNSMRNYTSGITPAYQDITLDAGETFAFQSTGQNAGTHMQGVHITSDVPIAVTIYDDSIRKRWSSSVPTCSSGYSYDVVGDQTIPTDLIGYDYIVMKGDVRTDDGGEGIFVTATVPGTIVTFTPKSSAVKTVTLSGPTDKNGFYLIQNTADEYVYVHATNPIYVFHCSGTGGGGELGGAILPTIDGCTGSHSVTVKRNQISSDAFWLNIMARNDKTPSSIYHNHAIDSFYITVTTDLGVSNTYHMPKTWFTYKSDSTWVFLNSTGRTALTTSTNPYYIKTGYVVRVDNNVSRFHLGVMNGGTSNGGKYGYFSDYADNDARAGVGGPDNGNRYQHCSLDPVQLVATGGRTYKWFCKNKPSATALLSSTTIADPYFDPDTTGYYEFWVIASGECYTYDTLILQVYVSMTSIADFKLSENVGCSPFTTTITNLSDTTTHFYEDWVIENSQEVAIYSKSIDNENYGDNYIKTIKYTFPDNLSDTIQKYQVRFQTKGLGNGCPSEKDLVVKVKPNVTAKFQASDSISCHPLKVQFKNLSFGHCDSTSYTWDFGDYSQSFDVDPSKSYDNYSLNDTTFTVTLSVESPLGCQDTATKQMLVHPRVSAKFVIDTSSACTPLNVNLDPTSSFGADTLWWNIDYWYGDSTLRTTQVNKIQHLIHYDTSLAAGPDTLYVQMIAGNRMGCRDTATTRRLVVYPEVIADFTLDKNEICDGDTIHITNTSQGYMPFFQFDWGDNNYHNIYYTWESNYPKIYYNRISDDSITYIIKLTAESSYFCSDTKTDTITVNPYITAVFSKENDIRCSPLNVIFKNNSLGADSSFWNFGYGEFLNNSAFWDTVFVNNDPDYDTTFIINLRTRNDEGCEASDTNTITVYPQVVANFTMPEESLCSPGTVHIANHSRGGRLNYFWDFGDNNSSNSNDSALTKEYNNETGSDIDYYITLTVTNQDNGCDSSWYDTINVLAYINSFFNIIPKDKGCSPFTISPVNYSSKGSREFWWNIYGKATNISVFTSLDSVPIIPPFINQGLADSNLIVQLIAAGDTNAAHLACADTLERPITVYPEMVANFLLTDTANCQPLTTGFVNNSNIQADSRFKWYIDGHYYSAATTPIDKTEPNLTSSDVTHKVTLYASTLYGCEDSISHNYTAYSLVDAYFTINRPNMCSGDSFLIDRTYTRGGITGYNWDFNGEESSTDPTVKFYHVYDNFTSSPLLKYTTLTVNNIHGCDSTWRESIEVDPKVTADFGIDDTTVCYPHLTIFTNNSVNADAYFWTFGDGASSSENDPTHYYSNFSKTTDVQNSILLRAVSEYNCKDSIRKNITVYAKPKADFDFKSDKSVGCPPFEATMENNSIGSALAYYWDFDGDGTSTDFEPSHVFSNTSSNIRPYPIMLIITSDKGCQDTIIKPVNVYPDVNVEFTASANFGCSPLNVQFNGDTTHVKQLLWYVDGTLFSTILDPTYRFNNQTPDNSTYLIRLIARSLYDCADTSEHSITVYPSPVPEFMARPLPAQYGTELDQTPITFTNETLFENNWDYQWIYGDGSTDNQNAASFDHIYPAFFWGSNDNNNRVMVYLIAWNQNNRECFDTIVHEIIIYPPAPQVDLAEDIAHCVPYTVDFSATTKYIDGTFSWDFGDGTTSTEAEPTHIYNTSGVFTVVLRVQGDGGTGKDYKIVDVYPQPEVDFSFNDSVVYDSSQTKGYDWINFYNHTKYANSFSWYFDAENNFGGTPDSDEKEPSWHYDDIGIYYIGLIATSGDGCVDSMIHPTPIKVLGEGYVLFPNAFFVTPDGPGDEYDTKREDNKLVFYPRNEGISEYHLEIYNRWGVLVFETKDVNHGWNGYIDGNPGKQDVYIWRVRGRFTNGQPYDKSGDVTLIHGRVDAVPQ